MKKLVLILGLALASVGVQAQQTIQNRYSGNYKSVTVNNFVGTFTSPVQIPKDGDKLGGKLIGVSFSFPGPVVGATVNFGYIRDGVTNIIFTETGDGQTFSWESDYSTGGWVLWPSDVLFASSDNLTPAQVTAVFWE